MKTQSRINQRCFNAKSLILAIFLVFSFTASAKHLRPSFGYHNHHYVYYPKQNFYYDPFMGTYVVYEQGVWVRQIEPPRLLNRININILPHVDVYVDSYYPYYYNHDHRRQYRLIYLVAPSTAFYVFRMPRRYDFSITAYTYYRPHHDHVVFYDPNCYRGHKHGKGHKYGHYKHHGRPYYGYGGHHDYPYGYPNYGHGHHGKPNHGPGPFGTAPHQGKPNNGSHGGKFPLGNKPAQQQQKPQRPFGAAPKQEQQKAKPFGTAPKQQVPMGSPKMKQKNSAPAPVGPKNHSKGNGKKGFGESGNNNAPQGAWPERRNEQHERNEAPRQNNMPQQREYREPRQQQMKQPERKQNSERSMPMGNPGGGKPQRGGGHGKGKG